MPPSAGEHSALVSIIHGLFFFQVFHWEGAVMEEQTGSPAATAENTNHRNGDEVSVRHPAAL